MLLIIKMKLQYYIMVPMFALVSFIEKCSFRSYKFIKVLE